MFCELIHELNSSNLINLLSLSVTTFTILANEIISTSGSSNTTTEFSSQSPDHLRVMTNIMNITTVRDIWVLSVLEVFLFVEPLTNKKRSAGVVLESSSGSVFTDVNSIGTVSKGSFLGNSVSPGLSSGSEFSTPGQSNNTEVLSFFVVTIKAFLNEAISAGTGAGRSGRRRRSRCGRGR